ncbi:MAG: hypothetical protein J7K78_03605 [Thaumarchaeota archaeon]|nr:hypothetical protein [Nitrososphaerota archaeon]
MKLIIVSQADQTSMAVGRILIENYGFKEVDANLYQSDEIMLRIIQQKHIYANGLGEDLNPELIVVASSHRSEAGIKALLTHPVGNWGDDASMGGLPKNLTPTSAIALYTALHALNEETRSHELKGWNIGLEVTHHGPAAKAPLIFVEAGGPPDEVPEEKALEAVASACLKACKPTGKPPKPAIGFGGGHYAPTFTKLALKGEYCFGHMCPKYSMPIDREPIIQAFEKTIEKPRLAVIDWKGIRGENRRSLIQILEDLEIEWVKA